MLVRFFLLSSLLLNGVVDVLCMEDRAPFDGLGASIACELIRQVGGTCYAAHADRTAAHEIEHALPLPGCFLLLVQLL